MLNISFLTLLETGGVVMLPLVACSVVSIAVFFERSWTLARAAGTTRRLQLAVDRAWEQGGLDDVHALALHDTSPLGAIYRAALADDELAPELRDRVARRHHARTTRGLKRYVWLLGTIGSLAPFIGLLGTVLGIVRAFDSMATTGSGGFAVVAAGISEALIATAGGLLVGILSIFAYNALSVRIANISALWREGTDDLVTRVAAQWRRS